MKNVMITGATVGIGYELARVFCQNGYKIIIVSSNKERLENAKAKLEKEYGVSISAYVQDLSQLGSAELLYNKIMKDNLNIDILINNAGFGLVGATDEIELKNDEQMMILNMVSLVELTKLFLVDMIKRKYGKILNVSSIGAFQPGPYTSTYFASKAFVLSYSRAIRFEVQKHNVDISTLCPGATKTDFFRKEGMATPSNAMSAEKVAHYTYRKFMKNKEIIIPGLLNRLMILLPTKLKMIGIARNKEQKL